MRFVQKIKTNKKTLSVGKFGVYRIVLDDNEQYADIYTAGGNIYKVKCVKVLDDEGKVVCNSRNHHKNLYKYSYDFRRSEKALKEKERRWILYGR